MLDFLIVPHKDGSNRLWVLTDGSINTGGESGGSGIRTGTMSCMFCKTWTYVIDPLNLSVLKTTKTEYDHVVYEYTPIIVYSNGKVYKITHSDAKNDPKIQIYSAESGDLLMDTKDFIEKYKDLSDGIASASYYNEDYSDAAKTINDGRAGVIQINTKSGQRGLIYSIANEKLFLSSNEYENDLEKDSTNASLFVLAGENGGKSQLKKELFLVNGPAGFLKVNRWRLGLDQGYDSFEESLEKRFYIKGKKISNKTFLRGVSYYQDSDCVIIIHLNSLEKNAERMMTCIDKTGKEIWTIQQGELFEKMKIIGGDNDFQVSQYKISVSRMGNLVVVKLKQEGIIGFDYKTGKKLFTID